MSAPKDSFTAALRASRGMGDGQTAPAHLVSPFVELVERKNRVAADCLRRLRLEYGHAVEVYGLRTASEQNAESADEEARRLTAQNDGYVYGVRTAALLLEPGDPTWAEDAPGLHVVYRRPGGRPDPDLDALAGRFYSACVMERTCGTDEIARATALRRVARTATAWAEAITSATGAE